MPKLARAPFDALSIHLPNQGTAAKTDRSSPSPSTNGEDKARVRHRPSPRRHAEVAPPRRPRPRDRDELSAPAVHAAPEGPAAPAPTMGVSFGGVVPAIGGISTPQPGTGAPPPGYVGAILQNLQPGGDAPSADPVGPRPGNGLGADGLAGALGRLSPR